MKSLSGSCQPVEITVAPYMGAWIEIPTERIASQNEVVAPYMGAWIEIVVRISSDGKTKMSLPTWERGLKFEKQIQAAILAKSLPTWERGLKSIQIVFSSYARGVAPYMGAWIEIPL